jgi:hypothetical protein
VLRDELFGKRCDFGVGEISEVKVGLLIFHESEIKSGMMAPMPGVSADHSESTHESGRVSSGTQAKWSHDDAIAAGSALHEEITIPSVRHGENEGDSEFFAGKSRATIHNAFDSAVRRQRRAVTWSPWIRFGGSRRNGCRFGDLDV